MLSRRDEPRLRHGTCNWKILRCMPPRMISQLLQNHGAKRTESHNLWLLWGVSTIHLQTSPCFDICVPLAYLQWPSHYSLPLTIVLTGQTNYGCLC